MKKFNITLRVMTFLAFTLAFSALAQAQATRTWVSGVGDDANPCSRTAPCKTWAGAISKTAASGEIDTVDPGGFGTLTITKSITIDGYGSQSSCLGSLTNCFNVNDASSGAPNTIVVTLRNITMQGVGNGVNGVNFTSGHTLHVENCAISGFTTSGISVSTTSTSRLTVKDTFIKECGIGVKLSTTASIAIGVLDNVRVEKCNTGVSAQTNAKVTLARSLVDLINNNATESTGASAELFIDGSAITNSGVGIAGSAGTVRISNNVVTGCTTSLTGTVNSFGDNKIQGNTTNTLPINNLAKS